MSQRTFVHGNYSIFTGWDRPLQYFFLVIERLDATDEDDDEGYAFSNLRLKNPGMTLPQIKETLQRYGIVWPHSLFADMEEDRQKNLTNFAHNYGE